MRIGRPHRLAQGAERHQASTLVFGLRCVQIGAGILRRTFNGVGGLHAIDHGQVQRIHPDHGALAFVAVLVPKTGRGQDQVAFVHGAFLTLNGGEAAFTFHHKAHGAGCVAVVGGHFARQDQLHAYVDVGCGHQFLDAMAWVAQHQNAALCFFNGR